MSRCLLFVFLAFPLFAQNRQDRIWKTSLAALGTANILDSASSWGKAEVNPALGSRFQWRGVAVKSGVFAASTYFGRKHKRLTTYVNFACAGALTALAVRNWRVGYRR